MIKKLISAAAMVVMGAQAATKYDYKGYTIDENYNFINNAKYNQKDIGTKSLTNTEILDIAVSYAEEVNAVGFFYQKHTNGHQIVGRYATATDMQGTWVKHSHDAGFVGKKSEVQNFANLRLQVKMFELGSSSTKSASGD